jgi:hypothetical protein
MRNAAHIHHFVKEMTSVCLQFRARSTGFQTNRILQTFNWQPAALQASSEQLSGKFPLNQEVSTSSRRICRAAPADDGPIVTGPAPPLGFPAVAHIYRSSRHDQIVTVAKEHVAARKHHAATLDCGQIYLAANLLEAIPIGITSPRHADAPRHRPGKF